MQKYNSKELRLMEVAEEERKKLKRNPVYIILDNVLDTYNVGSVFRLADAVAAEKVFLCGGTTTPPNHRIKKASINTTEWVEWEYASTAVEAISNLRKQFSTSLEQYSSSEAEPNREVKGIQVIAVEQAKNSIPYAEASYSFPVALVVGHESDGVSKDTMDACDMIVELPMWGVNKSMNVVVSLAIVLFRAMEHSSVNYG